MMLLGSGTMSAWQGDVTVQTPNTQLVLHAYEGGDLRMGYYGNKSATLGSNCVTVVPTLTSRHCPHSAPWTPSICLLSRCSTPTAT